MKKEKPTTAPRIPNGVCHNCGAPAVPYGCFCSVCYGAVLHSEGLPMVPGDPDDPYREFNASADACIADQKMPSNVASAIEWEAYQRTKTVYESRGVDVMFDPLTDAMVRAVAHPGENWSTALGRARELHHWPREMFPRQMLPCPHCQANYPARPLLWGWIDVGPNAPYIPDMCGDCEADPRQWRDYE